MDPASLASGGPPGADDPGAAMGLREQVAPSTVWPSTQCAHAVTYLALDSAAAIEQARTHLHSKLDLQGDARCGDRVTQRWRPSHKQRRQRTGKRHTLRMPMAAKRARDVLSNSQRTAPRALFAHSRPASPQALQSGAVRKRKLGHVPATMIAAAPGRTIIAS